MIELWKRNSFGMLNIFFYDRALSKHKHMEVQLAYHNWLRPHPDISVSVRLNPLDTHFRFNLCNIISFDAEFTRERDHAGLRIEFEGTLGFFIFQIYDTRHWNHSTESWDVNEYPPGWNYDRVKSVIDKEEQHEHNTAGKVDRSVSEDSTVQKRKRRSKKPRKRSG